MKEEKGNVSNGDKKIEETELLTKITHPPTFFEYCNKDNFSIIQCSECKFPVLLNAFEHTCGLVYCEDCVVVLNQKNCKDLDCKDVILQENIKIIKVRGI